MTQTRHTLHFFLGGQDLEMRSIRELLEQHAPGHFTDKHLAWGARLSDYATEIRQVIRDGKIPVAIELSDDLANDDPVREKLVIMDHHGPLAGSDKPTSLEQVFSLLGLAPQLWTRHYRLVAANDRGHVAEMKAMGATPEEIVTIRQLDRKAQGISPGQETKARQAIAGRKEKPGLTVIRSTGSSSSAIADLILPELGGPGYHNLLVIMPGKLAFYGGGEKVMELGNSIPHSWYGGALPEQGFWGTAVSSPEERNRIVRQIMKMCDPDNRQARR